MLLVNLMKAKRMKHGRKKRSPPAAATFIQDPIGFLSNRIGRKSGSTKSQLSTNDSISKASRSVVSSTDSTNNSKKIVSVTSSVNATTVLATIED